MTVERSERGALTTKADYYQSYQDVDGTWISTPQQWYQYDNKTVIRYFNEYRSSLGEFSVDKVMLSCTTNLNYELEYSVIAYTWDNVKWSESAWYDNNTPINQTLTSTQWNNSDNPNNTANIAWKWEIWVRRKDGGDLSRQDFQPCQFSVYRFFRQFIVQTTAIPQDWLTGTAGTYTTDFSTMTTVVPTVCDIDDNEFNAFIDIPNKIVAGINLCILGVGSLLNLKYVTFMICFVLIVGLVAWLIH